MQSSSCQATGGRVQAEDSTVTAQSKRVIISASRQLNRPVLQIDDTDIPLYIESDTLSREAATQVEKAAGSQQVAGTAAKLWNIWRDHDLLRLKANVAADDAGCIM